MQQKHYERHDYLIAKAQALDLLEGHLFTTDRFRATKLVSTLFGSDSPYGRPIHSITSLRVGILGLKRLRLSLISLLCRRALAERARTGMSVFGTA